MTDRLTVARLATACFIAVFVGGNMAASTPSGSVTVQCSSGAPSDLPPGFVAAFCAVLSNEITKNRSATAPPAQIDVDLARAGAFAVTASITLRNPTGAAHKQDFTLSVRDSALQPSIARTLVFPLLQLLE